MKYNKEMKVYLAYRNVFGSGNIDVYATYGPLAYVGNTHEGALYLKSNQKRRIKKEWKDAWRNYGVDWRGLDEV